jgi:hypothetical protein
MSHRHTKLNNTTEQWNDIQYRTMDNSNGNNNIYELTSDIQDTSLTKEQNFKQEEISLATERQSAVGGEMGISDNNDEYEPSEKWRIMKNIVVISLAFMVHFTAFQGAGNLQSSVNAVENLGTVSLATIYFSLILSNVFLPVVMIRLDLYIFILIFNGNMCSSALICSTVLVK